MKVALICPLNTKVPGGGWTYVVELKKALEEIGHTVDVFDLKIWKKMEILKEYDVVQLTTMSENGSKKMCKENVASKLHNLHLFTKYFVTVHDLKYDFRNRLDFQHMIDKSEGIIATSDSNKIELEKRFGKRVYKISIPFAPFEVEQPKYRSKIVSLTRFYPRKKSEEFFKLAQMLPNWEFHFASTVYDKKGKVIGGIGAHFHHEKCKKIIEEAGNVILHNGQKDIKEVLQGAVYSVDLSEQVDRDRPQYTTLEAFSAGVVPIIHPSFSGRMRDGKEVITAKTAEEARGKMKSTHHYFEMIEAGKDYLQEHVSNFKKELTNFY